MPKDYLYDSPKGDRRMDIERIISNLAFPIVVSFYCLFVINNTIKNNTQAINLLTKQLDKNCIERKES
jgi:hypothetical protein